MSGTPSLEGESVKSRLTLFRGNTLSFVDDEQRRWLSMYNPKLDTDETSAQISIEEIKKIKIKQKARVTHLSSSASLVIGMPVCIVCIRST